MLSLSDLRAFFTASFVAIVITACGGSSGDASTSNPLAGDSTANQPVSAEVLGDDIDSDGIRDDVQMMIEAEYSDNAVVFRRFTALAASDREVLASAHDQAAIDALYVKNLTAGLCLFEVIPLAQRDKLMADYTTALYDTPARAEAASLVSQRFSSANKGYFLPANLDCQ